MPLLSTGPARPTSGWRIAYRRLRRVVLARRRMLAALAAAAAAAFALQAAASPPPATRPVLTAAHDLVAGTVLTASDLRTAGYLPSSVPDGAVNAGQAI